MSRTITMVMKVHGESKLRDKLFESFVNGEIVDNVEVHAVSLEDEIARVEKFEGGEEE